MAERNGALLQMPVAALAPGATACQDAALRPAGSRARVPAVVAAGAVRARVVLVGGGRRVAGDWARSVDGALVAPLPRALPEEVAEVCVESAGPGTAELLGQPTGEEHRLRLGDAAGTGRMRVEYLFGDGPQPLWGRALLALPGRVAAAVGSAWAPWVAGAGAVAALAGLVLLVSGRRELLAVAVLALGSGAVWAGVTPLFQGGDELSHAAYVQVFAELGHPPRDRSNTGEVPDEMACWATFEGLYQVRFFQTERPPWRLPPSDPCAGRDRRKDAAQYQAAQPPAYYALATAGYRAAGALGRPLPDRLLLARLVSVLLAAVTVLCTFLLVRELLGASPWPARAAAVATALQPVVMFNHSTINSDSLLFATTAALAAVLARVWRRGPTLRRALLLGALLGAGVLAKITFLLVVPLVVAVQLLAWLRARSLPPGRRVLLLAASWGVALVPALAYVLLGDAIWEPSEQSEAGVAAPVGADKLRMVSYVWQAFLPPLPFMEDLFGGIRPPGVHAMIAGPATRLGWWDDYGIAAPWSTLLILAAMALVGFAALAAARRRAWRPGLAVAAGASIGYAVLLVAALYVPGDFQVQGRYMVTLTPVWGLAAGTTVAALRPDRQGAAAALLGAAMAGWTALALAATLGRWYL